MLLRSGQLPAAGGVPTTVVLTVTVDQLEHRTGLVTTGHGGTLPVDTALRLAADAQVLPAVLGDAGQLLAHGRARRLASPTQRLALAARDGGCSFPGCTTPAAWCETHHVMSWADGGGTDLDNLTLLCGHHHRHHERRGWRCVMTDGVASWIPPAWVDRERRPRRNCAHHLARIAVHPPPPVRELAPA